MTKSIYSKVSLPVTGVYGLLWYTMVYYVYHTYIYIYIYTHIYTLFRRGDVAECPRRELPVLGADEAAGARQPVRALTYNYTYT